MDYVSLLNSAKKTISEIAHDIATSQFKADVLPSKEQIIKETQERLERNQVIPTGISQARKYITDYMQAILQDPDYRGSIKAKLKTEKDIDDVIDAQIKMLKKKKVNPELLNDDTINEIKQKAREAYLKGMEQAKQNPLSGNVLYNQLPTVDKAGQIVQTYFKNPDERIRSNRILAAVGAYEVASIGGRVMSGGSLTADRYGRSDIAGVPFL